MSEINTSLVEIEGSTAPVATFGLQQPLLQAPPTSLNLAEHPLVKQQVDDYLVNLIDQARRERTTLEEDWRAIRRMEHMVHDGGRRYFGPHDSYLPLWARAKKSLTANLSRGLFPSDEYMDVADRASQDPERAKPVKALIQWEFETNANVRGNIKPALGEYSSLGGMVMKHWYRRESRPEGRSAKLGPFGGTGLAFGQAVREGFAVSARSMFNVYVWPTTAASLDEAVVLFEDIDVPRVEIERLIKVGKFVNGNAALEAPENDIHMSQKAEQHQNLHGMSPPQQSTLAGNAMAQVRTLTEVWVNLYLPREALLPNEDPECRYATRLVMAGNVCVEARRNPCLHQRPPYEWHNTQTAPGMFYGYGEGKLARPTQLLANDFFNQASDIGEYILNPIQLLNPSLMVGKVLPRAPGRIYQTLDVQNGMSWDRPPTDMIEHAMMMVNVIMGMNQDQSGAPAQSQGLTGKTGQTATQAQLLQRNAMTPLQDQVEDIELAVMIPLMRACWMYAQQWRSQQVIAMVAGQPMVVNPADLIIDPHFRWLASSQAMNQANRAQNAMNLLQAIGPMIPYLNQIGYLVDPAILLNRIFSDGFGFRGFSDFIKKVGPTPMMGPGGMPGQMPPGMAEQQGAAMDRARSTLEQVTSKDEAPGAVPGEGEEFMNVRQNADQLAAQNGGMNGKIR